jgi:DNA-binding transcriptional LysR family regulator
METHEIRYFLATARELNFTRAAAACGVSQPALTRAVKKLESELGGALFHRRPGLVALTRFGREMLPTFEAIETGMAAVRERAGKLAEAQASSLRLGVMCTVGPTHLVEILRKLRSKIPDLDVTIVEGAAREVVELVQADEVDVGIAAWPQYPEAIATHRVLDERYAVAMLDSDPMTEVDAVRLAQLSGCSYLERLSCEFDDYYEAKFGEWTIELDVRFASEREDWIQALILAGMGCAIVPEFMHLQPGIVTRPLCEPEVVREVSLIMQRGRRLPAAADAFLRTAAAHKWRPAA